MEFTKREKQLIVFALRMARSAEHATIDKYLNVASELSHLEDVCKKLIDTHHEMVIEYTKLSGRIEEEITY